MPDDSVLSFTVVAEASIDQQTACELADRVFCDGLEWLESAMLPNLRRWQGADGNASFIPWAQVKPLARGKGIVAHGHFDGKPGAPDARVARLALLVLYSATPPPLAVLLIRDTDNQPERRTGLEQARNLMKDKLVVVLGVAHPKRECWVLAGFEPRDEAEKQRLEFMRSELGFDPCREAEMLTARHDSNKRSAKRLLRELTGANFGRERACWTETDLPILRDRGAETGLTSYLAEVRERLTPLLTGRCGNR
jgi:hypothetical protein